MRKSEYKRLRQQIVDELAVLKAAMLKATAKLDALDLVWNDVVPHEAGNSSASNEAAPAEPVVDESAEKVVAVNGQAQSMIDEAASSMTGTFGVKEIEQAIATRHPGKTVNKTTIAGRLRKLVDDRQLEQTVKGVGRRPGSFKVIG